MTFSSRTCEIRDKTDTSAMFQFTRKNAESYNINLLVGYTKGDEARCTVTAIRFVDPKISAREYAFTEIGLDNKVVIPPILFEQSGDHCIPIPWGANFTSIRVYVMAPRGATGEFDLNISDGGHK